MHTSGYFTTNIRLILFLFLFSLLFACGGSDDGTPIGHFSYTVMVFDQNNEPIEGAEVIVELDRESAETIAPKTTDDEGLVVFTFNLNQANQGGNLIVKAEGYKEKKPSLDLQLNKPPQKVHLSLFNVSPLSESLETPNSTLPSSTEVSTSETSTSAPVATPIPSTATPIPPTPTPTSPTGNLAIPVVLGYDPKVYITGFDGEGINGPNPIPLDAQQPMFSRDGKSIMVKATIGGVIGLYKLTASGFTPEIVIKRGSAVWPVLSPDGKVVMFSEATLQYRLHKRLPSETIEDGVIEEIALNNFPIFAQNLLWSEDNRLVFHGCAVWEDNPSRCGTWVTPANNLAPQRIIEGNYAQPMATRAGLLAYMSHEAGDWDIYIISLDGGESLNLTNNDFADGLPAISPDGNSVAYISNESDRWGVWTIEIDGTNKKHWFDIDPSRGNIDIKEWSKERMSWRQ